MYDILHMLYPYAELTLTYIFQIEKCSTVWSGQTKLWTYCINSHPTEFLYIKVGAIQGGTQLSSEVILYKNLYSISGSGTARSRGQRSHVRTCTWPRDDVDHTISDWSGNNVYNERCNSYLYVINYWTLSLYNIMMSNISIASMWPNKESISDSMPAGPQTRESALIFGWYFP